MILLLFTLDAGAAAVVTDHSTVALQSPPSEAVVQISTPALSVALLEDPHDEVKL